MMLEELLRSQIQQSMAGLFGVSGKGGGGGNIFSTVGKLLGFASGGLTPGGRPIVVGERGPEVFIPASNGTVVPNSALGGGQSVIYNINAVDAPSFRQLLARDPTFLHAVAMQGARTMPISRR
jgi:phage-related minor tail protein